jgi:hypothetical protein
MTEAPAGRPGFSAEGGASPPVVSVSDVLNELSDQLKYASELDENGEPDNRQGVTYSLAYVIQALVRLNYQQDELRPLEKILFALGDLEVGIQPALFSKNIITNAPKQGHKEAVLYAMATVMIELLADKLTGDGEKKLAAEKHAALEVSKFMTEKKLPFPGRRDTPGSQSLLNWRKNMKHEQKNKIANTHYKFVSDLVSKMNSEEAVNMLRIRMAMD